MRNDNFILKTENVMELAAVAAARAPVSFGGNKKINGLY